MGLVPSAQELGDQMKQVVAQAGVVLQQRLQDIGKLEDAEVEKITGEVQEVLADALKGLSALEQPILARLDAILALVPKINAVLDPVAEIVAKLNSGSAVSIALTPNVKA